MRTVIGLTGGIGSGKTTVANLFAKHGITLVDADLLARQVVEPNSQGWQAILHRWGESVLQSDKQLDRAKLRHKIFSDPSEKHWLEQTLHPLIRQAAIEQMAQSTSPYTLWIVPLMVESGWDDLCDRLLVVDVSEETQIARSSARDGNSPEQIKRILAQQASRQTRNAKADDILHNEGDPNDLENEVAKLHQFYLALASQRAETAQ